MTLFITVRKVARSRDFYSGVLGGAVVLDENPCIVRLANSWIIMDPGGPPTPDKPDISVEGQGGRVRHAAADREAEIRCYLRTRTDTSSRSASPTSRLRGKLAAKRRDDLPG